MKNTSLKTLLFGAFTFAFVFSGISQEKRAPLDKPEYIQLSKHISGEKMNLQPQKKIVRSIPVRSDYNIDPIREVLNKRRSVPAVKKESFRKPILYKK